MKKNIIRITFLFSGILIAICMGLILFINGKVTKSDSGKNLVLLNEIEQLTRLEDGSQPATQQIDMLKQQLQIKTTRKQKNDLTMMIVLLASIMFIYMTVLILYLYIKVLKPFYRLEKYANQIASGDLDISLNYEKTNFFGAFTWAFDHMRKEIATAKRNEEQAVAANKTIIATLSHDIKTPIASIKTYSEALEAHLETDYEQRERYIQVILKKCDEVTNLTNDLVLHSLSELEKLEMDKKKIHIRPVLMEITEDFESDNLIVEEPFPDAILLADTRRLAQVVENIFSNAQKYATGAQVKVWAKINGGQYEIHIRDYGKGIPAEDMPFIFDKFYRGKNVENKPGSGLGLFIVKYITGKMQGDINLINHKDGLEAIVWFPILEEL